MLGAVALYGYSDLRQRQARTEWNRSLDVAVVLLTQGALEPAAIAAFPEALTELERHLRNEFHRYRSGPAPFRLTFFGPAPVSKPPPALDTDGFVSLAIYNYRQWRYTAAVDRALGLGADEFDGRIYVVARPPQSEQAQQVEGYGQQGGRIGIVQVELNRSMLALVLSVVAHELFHTLGATDKYDALGQSLRPEGMAEPNREPLFPQTHVEIMSRNRPLAPGREVPLEGLDELRVGPFTAREIGWLD